MTVQEQELRRITNCQICGEEMEFDDDVVMHELIECAFCATEFEVTQLTPIEIQEVEFEGEDWGQ